MARCLKAVRFTTVIGQSVYNYSAMTGDNTAISATSEVEAVMYGAANIDLAVSPPEITLGATDITFNFSPADVVGVTILFYP